MILGKPPKNNIGVEEMTTKKELMQEADKLGITYSPNIGEATLRKKIEDFRIAQEVIEESVGKLSKHELDNQLREQANKLVRIQVTCMNPQKHDQQGTIVMASNSVVGTHRKYISFNVPWHMPQILVNALEEKEFAIPTKGNGRKLVKEYQVTYLPDLTPEELADLKHQQAIKATKE